MFVLNQNYNKSYSNIVTVAESVMRQNHPDVAVSHLHRDQNKITPFIHIEEAKGGHLYVS